MLMTMISMLGGGLIRLLPEVFAFLNKKTDNEHELAMLDKQFALESTREAAKQHTIEIQGGIDQTLALLAAQQSALAGQMQRTGLWIVDALNFLVRPLTTYFFLALFGMVKIATLVVALRALDPWLAIVQCWTPDDAATLSGILGFWFVSRVFDKK